MIGKSDVFGFGELFSREIQRLIRSGLLDPNEAAALVSQIVSHCDLAADVVRQQNGPKELSPLLEMLCNSGEIEEMLFSAISPHATGQSRKRRYAIYSRIIGDAKLEFLIDSESICRQCVRAREWPMYAREEMRQIRVRWLFLELYLAGIKFRFGLRSDVRVLTARLRDLTVGLPHRRQDCAA